MGLPALASTYELCSWWKKSLLEVATTENLTLTQGYVAAVAASGATLDATEAHELTVINERPALHSLILRSNTSVLLPRVFSRAILLISVG